MSATKDFCVGLDLGLKKITCMVGKKEKNGMRISSLGKAQGQGINRRGIITDSTQFRSAVKEAINNAELHHGETIRNLSLSISGDYISFVSGYEKVNITGNKIVPGDIKRAINLVKRRLAEQNRFKGKNIIQILPYRFIIDDDREVRTPEGLNADNLIVYVNFIIADERRIQDIIQVMNSLNIRVDNFLAGHYTTGKGIIPDEIYDEIVGVIDFGAGMTKVSVFRYGKFEFLDTVYFGADKINDDVASMCRTTFREAERMKRSPNVELFLDRLNGNETVSVKGADGSMSRKISKIHFNRIVEARVEELMNFAINKMRKAPSFDKINYLVVTGGGANIRGFLPYVEEKMKMRVKLGKPTPAFTIDEDVSNPIYAQPYGVLCAMCRNGYLEKGNKFVSVFKQMFK